MLNERSRLSVYYPQLISFDIPFSALLPVIQKSKLDMGINFECGKESTKKVNTNIISETVSRLE